VFLERRPRRFSHRLHWHSYQTKTAQLGEKYFRLLRLQHRRLHLRQLRFATFGGSLPRTCANYRQRSWARRQLAPECRKSPSRPAISSTSATR
jgi:hypothetical protein